MNTIDLFIDRAFETYRIRKELERQAKNWIQSGRLDDFKPSDVPDTLKELVEEKT